MADFDSGVDISILKNLYLANKTSNIAFEIFKSREKDSKITKLERLEDLIRAEGGNPSREEIVTLMKGLQEANCGRFIVGRRGAQSRFEWGGVSLKSVGMAATSASEEVTQMAEDADEQDADDETSEVYVDDSITHAFVLRPDCLVKLKLPVDLTAREAKRLADFLRTLPFDDFDSLET